MPQRSKGARLWLRPAWGNDKPVWIIRDGQRRIGTGFGPNDRERAEARLTAYLAQKHQPSRERGRDPAQVKIADVVSIYATDRGSMVANPKELGQRLTALLKFWGTMTLVEVNGPQCRFYAAQRGSKSMARRELEDLRAAINHHHREGLCNAVVKVVLPERGQSRDRWLTRSEAAALIRAAWRYREVQKGKKTGRASRRHVARFILVGLYTGTRSGAICGAALHPAIGRGYVDLGRGEFHRRARGARETKKRQPPIQLPDRLLVHMRRWARLGISRKSVIEFDGQPVKSVRKAFARTVRDAGLLGVTPHVLRHTAVSWAVQNSISLGKVAEFFGMTGAMIERVYGHMSPDQHREVGDAITGRRRAVSGQFQRNKT